MSELVTVIIPVYNKLGQLERCVTSVTGQTYEQLQILLVDDGSTDGSAALCDTLAGGDSRIEVVHRPNGGVSAARNTGLEHMRGEWVAFVDADDYVSPHYIEDMYAALNCGDIAICGSVWVPNDGADVPFRRVSHTERISGWEASIRHFNNHSLYNPCWGKLYRASLWAGLSFPEGRLGEDLHVSHSLLYRAEQVAVTDALLYAYVQSAESLMRADFSPRRFDALDGWQEGVRVFNEAGDRELEKIALRTYCSRSFDALCICKKELPQDRETLRRLRIRANAAYREARRIYSYIDCTRSKAIAYRLMLLLGRWCLPLYNRLFVRGKWRGYI